jgi:hypothetical protein
MPIRPEDRDRYPKDWNAISQRVRDEAGQMCEWCSVPNGVLIRRGVTEDCRRVWRLASASASENGRASGDGSEVPDSTPDTVSYGYPVRVVLTVAHLDHQPENVERWNLKALCQRCHNAYDAANRRNGINARARSASASGDLFQSDC